MSCPNSESEFPSHLINKAVLSVDHIGVLPWALFLWVIWLILHSIYKKCFEALLIRIRIKEAHREQLIQTYWRLAFACATLPFFLQNLSIPPIDRFEDLTGCLDRLLSSGLIQEAAPSVALKLSYVVITGFYLNSLCEISTRKGVKTCDFFAQEFLTTFFISTFPLRCIQYGIAFTTITNLEKSLYELTRLCCCFSEITKSKLLRRGAGVLLFIHTILWFLLYFHVVPSYFLFQPFHKTHRDEVQLAMIVLLGLSLWSYYFLEIYSSPLSRFATNYIHRRLNDIEDILFDKDSEPDQIFSQDNHFNTSKEREMTIEQKMKNRENLLLMYYTVKCAIRIKRKLKRMREAKNTEGKPTAS